MNVTAALALVLLLPPCCLAGESGAVASDAPAPATLSEYTQAVVSLLSQTELSLNGCRDAASVTAALPRLRDLARQAERIAASQEGLPDPTVQDYLAAHPQIKAFNTLWKAISGHIDRLEEAGLMTPELREVLKVAPDNGK